MNTINKTSRILGVAFLFQFVTSFSNGLFLQPAWLVPDNISQTMLNIANAPWLMRTSIFLDMLTALGVIFLGVMKWTLLSRHTLSKIMSTSFL
jgi:hypothetical protein